VFGFSFEFFSGSSVDLGVDGFEFAGNMGGVAIEDGGISGLDLSWMVENDDLCEEVNGFSGWVVFLVSTDVSSFDVFDGNVFNVETDVVPWDGFGQLLVMHFDGFDLGFDVNWCESDIHTGFDDSGLDSSDGYGSDSSDLVDILQWESEGFVGWSLGWDDHVEGLEQSHSFVPWHVVGWGNHVVTDPTGNGDEWDFVGVITDFLQVCLDLEFDLVISGFSVVH